MSCDKQMELVFEPIIYETCQRCGKRVRTLEDEGQCGACLRRGKKEQVLTVRHELPAIGRNAPCPCNSGKKFKLCCGRRQSWSAAQANAGDDTVRGKRFTDAVWDKFENQ